jgi:hypothetical protein
MNTDKNTICDFVLPDGKICGHKCKPRGIGAHKRAAHGFVERVVVVDHKNDLSTQVKSVDIQKSNLSGRHLSTQVKPDLSTQVKNDLSTQVKRPSDFVKKHEVVVKKEEKSLYSGGSLVVFDYLNGITSDGRKRTKCRLCGKELWVAKEIADRDSCGCVVCDWCIKRTHNGKDLQNEKSVWLTGHVCDVNGVSLKEISLRE